METFLRATEITGADAAIRLEDDVILTQDWRTKVEAQIAERPNDLIQFFSRSKYDVSIGSRYKSGAVFTCNVCIYLPPGFSKELFDYYKVWPRKKEHPTGLDYLIADLMKEKGMSYWVCVPNLADHSVSISQISSRRPRRRVSTTFVNPELKGYPARESGV